jgi:hypothetical protein
VAREHGARRERLKREVWAQVRSVGTESAFLSPMPLKTMSETNRNVSRTAESLAIPRDTIRVRAACRQPVREPARSVVGWTPPERPSR